MPPARRQHREILKILKAGTYATDDPQGQINVFRELQKYNQMPQGYDTPDELLAHAQALKEAGYSVEKIREYLGVDSTLTRELKINGRAIRDKPSPAMTAAIDDRAGDGVAQYGQKGSSATWSLATKENAEAAANLGFRNNNGHVAPSAGGNGRAGSAQAAEVAELNQMAGRSERNPARPVPPDIMNQNGITATKLAGEYEGALYRDGIPTGSGRMGQPVNPYVGFLIGTDLGDTPATLTGYINPAQIEGMTKAFDELTAQGYNPVAMYDHVVATGGNTDVKSMAEAGLNTQTKSVFAGSTMPRPLNEPPVRQIAPAVVPYKTPQPNSVTLGQKAAAIATREPLPQPKPQPLVVPPKPVAKPAAKHSVKSSGTRRGAAAGTRSRPPSRSTSGSGKLAIGQSPLSPLNKNSNLYGATERRSNEMVQDLPGYSPFMLKLAD